MIRERLLKFPGHCIRMPTDESINLFVLYESKVRPSLRLEAPTRTYGRQILSLPGEKTLKATDIWKIVVNKSACNKHFVVSKTYLLMMMIIKILKYENYRNFSIASIKK